MLRNLTSSARSLLRTRGALSEGINYDNPVRNFVSRGSGSALTKGTRGAADPIAIDSAVNQVAGEVTIDQLEPHELKRMRQDREKQLDIRNFTLNFGPQHPVRFNFLLIGFCTLVFEQGF